MSDSDFYLPLPRIVINRNQVVNKKWKLRVRSNPTQEKRVHQTKISTKSDNDGFSPSGGVQVKIRTKNSSCWMFGLLRLCFVFYDEIYVKNE